MWLVLPSHLMNDQKPPDDVAAFSFMPISPTPLSLPARALEAVWLVWCILRALLRLCTLHSCTVRKVFYVTLSRVISSITSQTSPSRCDEHWWTKQ